MNHGIAEQRGLVESRYPKSQSTGFEKGNQWQESSPSEAALQRALTLCLALNKDPVVIVRQQRQRERYRQTDRQTGRQADRQTDRRTR